MQTTCAPRPRGRRAAQFKLSTYLGPPKRLIVQLYSQVVVAGASGRRASRRDSNESLPSSSSPPPLLIIIHKSRLNPPSGWQPAELRFSALPTSGTMGGLLREPHPERQLISRRRPLYQLRKLRYSSSGKPRGPRPGARPGRQARPPVTPAHRAAPRPLGHFWTKMILRRGGSDCFQ